MANDNNIPILLNQFNDERPDITTSLDFQNTVSNGPAGVYRFVGNGGNQDLHAKNFIRANLVDDIVTVQGAIRYNNNDNVFQGYSGNEWLTFTASQGQAGADGTSFSTVVQCNNLINTGETDSSFGLFKDVVLTTTVTDEETTTEPTSNEILRIHSIPSIKYTTNTPFDLSQYTINFIPSTPTEYYVGVRKNDIWPQVPYTTMTSVNSSISGSITADGYFVYNIPTPGFFFYGQQYTNIYINFNGFITFNSSEAVFNQNIYQNHLSKKRISLFYANLIPSSDTANPTDIFIGTGKYGEIVITYNNFLIYPGTNDYVNAQVRLFLSNSISDSVLGYSDDYYSNGTIQISYNSVNHDTPLIGLSNGNGYNSSTFQQVNFKTLEFGNFHETTKPKGLPKLRIMFVFKVKTTGGNPLEQAAQTKFSAMLPGTSSETYHADNASYTQGDHTYYKIIFNDFNDSTNTYLEAPNTGLTKVSQDKSEVGLHYIKTLDLGNIQIDKMAVAIRSIFDYDTGTSPVFSNNKSYSDLTSVDNNGTSNLFPSNSDLVETNWQSLLEDTTTKNSFINLNELYNDEVNTPRLSTLNLHKDYKNIYNSTTDLRKYNSRIYRIQGRFSDKSVLNESNRDNKTFEKTLLIKTIFELNSDIDLPTNASSFNTAQLLIDSITNGPYHITYVNDEDWFSISFPLNISKTISIVDFKNESNSSNMRDGSNISLRMYELINNVLTEKSVTITTTTNNFKKYNFPYDTGSSANKTYYIQVTSTGKFGFYGLKLENTSGGDVIASNIAIDAHLTSYKFTRLTSGAAATTNVDPPAKLNLKYANGADLASIFMINDDTLKHSSITGMYCIINKQTQDHGSYYVISIYGYDGLPKKLSDNTTEILGLRLEKEASDNDVDIFEYSAAIDDMIFKDNRTLLLINSKSIFKYDMDSGYLSLEKNLSTEIGSGTDITFNKINYISGSSTLESYNVIFKDASGNLKILNLDSSFANTTTYDSSNLSVPISGAFNHVEVVGNLLYISINKSSGATLLKLTFDTSNRTYSLADASTDKLEITESIKFTKYAADTVNSNNYLLIVKKNSTTQDQLVRYSASDFTSSSSITQFSSNVIDFRYKNNLIIFLNFISGTNSYYIYNISDLTLRISETSNLENLINIDALKIYNTDVILLMNKEETTGSDSDQTLIKIIYKKINASDSLELLGVDFTSGSTNFSYFTDTSSNTFNLSGNLFTGKNTTKNFYFNNGNALNDSSTMSNDISNKYIKPINKHFKFTNLAVGSNGTAIDNVILLGFNGDSSDSNKHIFLEKLGYNLDVITDTGSKTESQEGKFHKISTDFSSKITSNPGTFEIIQQETIYITDKYYKGMIYYDTTNSLYKFNLYSLGIDTTNITLVKTLTINTGSYTMVESAPPILKVFNDGDDDKFYVFYNTYESFDNYSSFLLVIDSTSSTSDSNNVILDLSPSPPSKKIKISETSIFNVVPYLFTDSSENIKKKFLITSKDKDEWTGLTAPVDSLFILDITSSSAMTIYIFSTSNWTSTIRNQFNSSGFIEKENTVYGIVMYNDGGGKTVKLYKFPSEHTPGTISDITGSNNTFSSNSSLTSNDSLYGLYYTSVTIIPKIKILCFKTGTNIYFYFLTFNKSSKKLIIRVINYSTNNNNFSLSNGPEIDIDIDTSTSSTDELKILQFDYINDKSGNDYVILSYYQNNGNGTDAYENRKFCVYENNSGTLNEKASGTMTNMFFVDIWDNSLLVMRNTSNGLKFTAFLIPTSTNLTIADDTSGATDFPVDTFTITNIMRTLQSINRYGTSIDSSIEDTDERKKYRFDFITMNTSTNDTNLGFEQLGTSERKYSLVSYGSYITSSSSSSGGSTSSTTTADSSAVEKIVSHFYESFLGNSTNSIAVIGKKLSTTNSNNDSDIGTNYFLYLSAYKNTGDTTYAYLKTSVIPNYIPFYGGKQIKGLWKNEIGGSTDADISYSIEQPSEFGWLDTNSTSYGNPIRITSSQKDVNSKTIIVNNTTIVEQFWYTEDDFWNTIMINSNSFSPLFTTDSSGNTVSNSVNTSNLNGLLLTPIGPIGTAINGTMIYNFVEKTSTVTYANLSSTNNAVTNVKLDHTGGVPDDKNLYHYHKYPVSLEAALKIGDIADSSSSTFTDKSSLITFSPRVGETYFFNQSSYTNTDFPLIFKTKKKANSSRTSLATTRYNISYSSSGYALTFNQSTDGTDRPTIFENIISDIMVGDIIEFLYADVSDTTNFPIYIGDSLGGTSNSSLVTQSQVTDSAGTYLRIVIGSTFTDNILYYTNSNNNKGDAILTGKVYKYLMTFALKRHGSGNCYYLQETSPSAVATTERLDITNIGVGDILFLDYSDTSISATTNIPYLSTNSQGSTTAVEQFDTGGQFTSVTSNVLRFTPDSSFKDTKLYYQNAVAAGMGGLIRAKTSENSSYNFSDTFNVHGNAGVSRNSHIRFTIPPDFDYLNMNIFASSTGTGTDNLGGATDSNGMNTDATGIVVNPMEYTIKYQSSIFEFYFGSNKISDISSTTIESFEGLGKNIELYEGFTYKITKDSTLKTEESNEIRLRFSETSTHTAQYLFDDTYKETVNYITFTVPTFSSTSEPKQLYVYSTAGDSLGSQFVGSPGTIKILKKRPRNFFVFKEAGTSTDIFKLYNRTDFTTTLLSSFENRNISSHAGFIDYELGKSYLDILKSKKGSSGHSPILGYAFDGFPIYGPYGYDHTDSNYSIDDNRDTTGSNGCNVKLMLSSYTGPVDSIGNPTYIQRVKDTSTGSNTEYLDICNGRFGKTPEYTSGIYHYYFTLDVDLSGFATIANDGKYGYFNGTAANIIQAKYPYTIGAFRGVPDIYNFRDTYSNTSEATTTTTSTNSVNTYTINFKSIKSAQQKNNGTTYNSVNITQDDKFIHLRPEKNPYIWNFTNEVEQGSGMFHGYDSISSGNTISGLRSATHPASTQTIDDNFKAYGNISKWIANGTISRGEAVQLFTDTDNTTLKAQRYDTTGISAEADSQTGLAFLGIALNDASDGGKVYVCTKGITTVKLGNDVTSLAYGSYGILKYSAVAGAISGLLSTTDDNASNIILAGIPVAGYFLENYSSGLSQGKYVLFYVKGSIDFN